MSYLGESLPFSSSGPPHKRGNVEPGHIRNLRKKEEEGVRRRKKEEGETLVLECVCMGTCVWEAQQVRLLSLSLSLVSPYFFSCRLLSPYPGEIPGQSPCVDIGAVPSFPSVS